MLNSVTLEAILLKALDCLASSALELQALSVKTSLQNPAITRRMLRERANQLFSLANQLEGLEPPNALYKTRKAPAVIKHLRVVALGIRVKLMKDD